MIRRIYPRFSNWLVRRSPRFGAFLARQHAKLSRIGGGRFVNRFLGAPMLILVTIGRRSGKRRETPLMYLEDEGRYVVAGTNAAATQTPAWVHNVLASGEGEVTVRGRAERVSARLAEGAERERIWPRLVQTYGGYERYREMAEREIPVVVLTPR
jgi:deazaflavin-dependent oxidoreductase (nitroreductase family)